MDRAQRERLEAHGWKVGDAREFLGLTAEEAAYLELKMTLSRKVKELRQKKRLTQVEAARLLRSSQSRVARMEAGDASVSLDLLVRSLFALGASSREVGRAIAAADSAH